MGETTDNSDMALRQQLTQGGYEVALLNERQRRIAAEEERDDMLQQLTEAQQALATVGITQIDGVWCYTSERGEKPAATLADALQRTFALIDRDLVAQRDAELDAVRMVDSLLVVDGARLCYSDRSRMVQLWNDDTDDGVSVLIEEAASIPALGRALAAQEVADG